MFFFGFLWVCELFLHQPTEVRCVTVIRVHLDHEDHWVVHLHGFNKLSNHRIFVRVLQSISWNLSVLLSCSTWRISSKDLGLNTWDQRLGRLDLGLKTWNWRQEDLELEQDFPPVTKIWDQKPGTEDMWLRTWYLRTKKELKLWTWASRTKNEDQGLKTWDRRPSKTSKCLLVFL